LGLRRVDLENALWLHGVPCVEEEIQKYLLELALIAANRFEIGVQLYLHLYARFAKLMFEQGERFFDHGVDPHLSQIRGPGAREVEQRIHNLARPECLAGNFLQHA